VTPVPCPGCGRPVEDEEIACSMCGRAHASTAAGAVPPGWQTADATEEPAIRRVVRMGIDEERPGAADDGTAGADDVDPFRVPATPAPAASGGGGFDVASGSGAETPPYGPGIMAGGKGWRVRLSASQAALDAVEASRATEAVAIPVANPQAPAWVYPLLITGILGTSLAALVLVAFHLLHSLRS
jgi:hypothetical protein